MADERPTAYDLLGVSPQASPAEITSAYRGLLRRHHPDSRPAAPGRDDAAAGDEEAPQGDAAEALRSIMDAYAMLRDPGSRASYDRRQAERRQRTGWAPRPSPPTTSAPAGEDLLRAGPVSWQQAAPSTGGQRRPAAAEATGEREVLEQLLQLLRSRWHYR